MRKVLILHISQFGGHKKASENIEEALRYKDFSTEVLNINGFGHIMPRIEKAVDFLYTHIIKYTPFIWGSLYDKPGLIKSLTPFKKCADRIGMAKLSKLLHDFSPDIVVTTQAFPCGIVADFKKCHKFSFPLIAVVTDYYPHRFWLHPCIDTYTVACQEAKVMLTKEGVEEEKIKVLGIPISVKFLTTYSKKEIGEQFGFHKDIPTILLMGGGIGIGPIQKIAQILDTLDEHFQVIAVCGNNRNLLSWFQRKKSGFKKPFFCFSYIEFVNKLMDFSDIIITKGGGLTISEALAKGMAIIVVSPIPGQEERNAQYLEKKNAIIRVSEIEDIPRCVRVFLHDRAFLFTLKENARQQAVVDSSLRIANLVLKFLH